MIQSTCPSVYKISQDNQNGNVSQFQEISYTVSNSVEKRLLYSFRFVYVEDINFVFTVYFLI